MNTYTVYYRNIGEHYCCSIHVDAYTIEQAINKGLQYLEYEEHLDYSEIEICHVEKEEGEQ